MELAISIIMVLACLFLIVTILLQHGSTQGAGGAVTGTAGAAETFFGKNKANTMDAILSKVTTVVAVIFVIGTLALNII